MQCFVESRRLTPVGKEDERAHIVQFLGVSSAIAFGEGPVGTHCHDAAIFNLTLGFVMRQQ